MNRHNNIHDISKDEFLGQVWTPADIAKHIVKMASAATDGTIDRVLDPGCGPGVFEKAFVAAGITPNYLLALDVDPLLAKITNTLIKKAGFNGEAKQLDYFACMEFRDSFDMVIMNPPYIRQELISPEEKYKIAFYLKNELGVSINKRSNLLIYFLFKAIVDLKAGGVLCAIIYDSVMQTSYGKKAMDDLQEYMEPISYERIEAPFENVIIDAHIILMRKREKPVQPADAIVDKLPPGMANMDDLLITQRGTALPYRKVIVASDSDKFYSNSTGIFIKQSRINGLILKDPYEKAYLIKDEKNNAQLTNWLLKRCRDLGYNCSGIRCRPIEGPILFNYYIRNNPRHLINTLQYAASDNFYVSSPKSGFPIEAAWLLLNSDMYLDCIMQQARRQGSGLLKLQLYEYRNALVPDWNLLTAEQIKKIRDKSIALIKTDANAKLISDIANQLVDKHIMLLV